MVLRQDDLILYESTLLVVGRVTDSVIQMQNIKTDQTYDVPSDLLKFWDWKQLIIVRPSTREFVYHDEQAAALGWDPEQSGQTAVTWLCEQLRSTRFWANLPTVPETSDPETAALQLLAAGNWIYSSKVGCDKIPAECLTLPRGSRVRTAIALLFEALRGYTNA